MRVLGVKFLWLVRSDLSLRRRQVFGLAVVLRGGVEQWIVNVAPSEKYATELDHLNVPTSKSRNAAK